MKLDVRDKAGLWNVKLIKLPGALPLAAYPATASVPK